MNKSIKIFIALVLLVFLAYWQGPQTVFEPVSSEIVPLDVPITKLDSMLTAFESQFPHIKPENESRIIWADTVRQTPYAMVYLHGFSAGVMESDPVHRILAKKYGCNLYLARLSHHGLSGQDAFEGLTPAALMHSAAEAVAVGRVIGKKVILISCSTGGTLSIYLTAHNPDLIDAQILYSPNTAIDDPTAALLNKPWGKHLTQLVIGDYKIGDSTHIDTPIARYWTLTYRSDALIALQELLDQTMKDEVFEQISSPYFIGYYYKNEEESDHVISVPGIIDFDSKTKTPANQKRVVPFPNVGHHVMASDLQSKDIESVIKETSLFIEQVLGLSPTSYDSLNRNGIKL
ncbi:alpha/beta hydrolase [Reichenbachiella carrageenanivorans]|uniref:Alpha/beta hydrolase n=1 Tax=Reichenbachiella carrageenanivorans TaxID=2979869 RepID=A0ABY6CYM1_9BACT|nr:alpha/beta hydrolase [Reichenbachiella carrageenanivorans]UXX79015.1 alpha/beta hydrolase [Reichenbachiella carrageenanivorans]